MADQDQIASALQDYFNCHHCPTSSTLRKEVGDRLFNVLTPETVNRLYTIETTIGPRIYSPLQAATQTENIDLTKRLLVELEANILLSEGTHGISPLKNLLGAYAKIGQHPLQSDAVVEVLAAGLARVKDTSRLPTVFNEAVRVIVLPEKRTELLRDLGPALRKEMRDIAWSRRRHLVGRYYSENEV